MTADTEKRSVVPLGRGLVKTKLGSINYVTAGDKDTSKKTLVCFHMSPRSSDEYKEVKQLLAEKGNFVVAIDIPGYGASDNPTISCTLDEIAEASIEVCDSLGIDRFVAVGSLLGNFICASLATKFKDRILGLVLTNLYHWPQNGNQVSAPFQNQNDYKKQKKLAEDTWKIFEDGSHLTNIWNARKAWLSVDLNNRVSLDDFNYHVKRKARYAEGIVIQDPKTFDFLTYFRSVECPTLLLTGLSVKELFDKMGFNMTEQLKQIKSLSKKNLIEEEIEGGTINLVNQSAEEWANTVANFLEEELAA